MKKRTMFSRGITLLLIICMLVSFFLPITAFTEEAEQPELVAKQTEESREEEVCDIDETLCWLIDSENQTEEETPSGVDTNEVKLVETGDTLTDGEPLSDREGPPSDTEPEPDDMDDSDMTTEEQPAADESDPLEDKLIADADSPDIFLMAGIGIMPLSGWIDDGSDFHTKIYLTVRDNKGNPIGGVTYAIYLADNDELVGYMTSQSDGMAESNYLPVNYNYYLLEHAIPDGWHSNEDRKDIILTEECAPSRVDVTVEYDPYIGTIKIIKTNELGEKLEGVGFYVRTGSSTERIATLYTDENGEASFTVPYGNYLIVEFAPLPGYMSAEDQYAFVEYHGSVEVIEITNRFARGYISVSKIGNDGRKISGAVFDLYKADGTWVMDVTTDQSGSVWINDLLPGYYYLVEKSVPTPYVVDTETRHQAYIYGNGSIATVSIENLVAGTPSHLTIIKTDDKGNPLEGVVFAIYRTWDNTKICELTTDENGTVTTTQALIPDEYYVQELSGKDGYEMHTDPISFTVDGTGAIVTLTVVNPKIPVFGKVKVVKQDETGELLDGVTFGVYCVKDNLLEEITTVDGTAISGVLNAGSYYLKEHSAADGHVMSEEKHPFTITENNVIVTVDVVNPRITGYVKVIKTGTGEIPLPDVMFGVYKAGTEEKLCELTTGEDGTITSAALLYGEYELRELETADGYFLITTPIPFSILEQDVVIEIPVSNSLILGNVKIIKTDAAGTEENPLFLSGAVFGLFNSKGQKVEEMTTGENGEAVYQGLPKGEYHVRELTAPQGYILVDTATPFTITEQGQMIELPLENSLGNGSLKIIKRGDGGALLPDVVFEVYNGVTDEMLQEILTNENGIAEISLPAGSYYLKETQTAEGYLLPEETIPFLITEHGGVVELPLTNTQGKGTVHLTKTNEAGAPLSGAVFSIFSADDVFIADMVTGMDGTATYDLPIGGYYLLEKTAPQGYFRDIQKHGFIIASGMRTNLTVVNTSMLGTVEVYFRHMSDSRELAVMRSLTDQIGTDYIMWMRENDYEHLPIEGYEYIHTEYPASLVIVEEKLIVTLWYDDTPPEGGIIIPQTGDIPPYLNYAFAMLMWCMAAYCAYTFFQSQRRVKAEA